MFRSRPIDAAARPAYFPLLERLPVMQAAAMDRRDKLEEYVGENFDTVCSQRVLGSSRNHSFLLFSGLPYASLLLFFPPYMFILFCRSLLRSAILLFAGFIAYFSCSAWLGDLFN